jgi:hypothetical protein
MPQAEKLFHGDVINRGVSLELQLRKVTV